MGSKVSHDFLVEVWEGGRVAEVMAAAGNIIVAQAAFEAAVGQRPGRRLTLRHGARVIRSAGEDAASRPAPPTVGLLRGQGVMGARLWCVGCKRQGILTWEQMRAREDEPFPSAGGRLRCGRCGSDQVTRMPDWPS
ncbi:hypothetical protein [Phreatobacter sp.]|uniref:hypothetical protein n=1 Tax=Phreatobacter sp. TaxID=1966341 RepID=UPI003F72E680